MASQDLSYSFTHPIHPNDLLPLFKQADWTADRTRSDIQRMLDHSRVYLGAWDGSQLVGFARVITDDVYRAFIEDIIVEETWRGQGVGREIVRRLLTRLGHVQEVFLSCRDELVTYYGALGFKPYQVNVLHMRKTR